MNMRQDIYLPGDACFKFFDAGTSGGGGFEDAYNIGIFLLQAGAVNIERMLIGFITNNQNRRISSEGLDNLEPVFYAVLFLGQAGIEH